VSITRPETSAPRRRRSPESAEREILDAAESFLRERPFRDLTVDEVMARTTLSRPSFYVYFRDRHHLAVRLVEGIGDALFAMSSRWLEGSGDPREDIRESLRGVAEVYDEHGLVLHAIADAAGHDPEVERVYYGLIDRFVVATTARIEADLAAGRVSGLDATPTAGALVWMSERYLLMTLGRLPKAPVDTVVETLATIWIRTLYTPGT
jgi:TetR/AcrR family transcriptional regulator, ethionamide resistance regulator